LLKHFDPSDLHVLYPVLYLTMSYGMYIYYGLDLFIPKNIWIIMVVKVWKT